MKKEKSCCKKSNAYEGERQKRSQVFPVDRSISNSGFPVFIFSIAWMDLCLF